MVPLDYAAPTTLWEPDRLDLPGYLKRIGYDGPLEPTVATLRALQKAHLETIPFEGLDSAVARGVWIDIDSIQDKLVHRRRGGYCHEHNSLFATVLNLLGFQVSGRSAEVLLGKTEGELGPPGHTILSVSLEGVDWHVDVGIGSAGPRAPIPLLDGLDVATGAWTYRIQRTPWDNWVLRLLRADGWFNVIQFDETHYNRADFEAHNIDASTSPTSPFTQRIIVEHNGEDQRITLADLRLSTYWPSGEKETREITPAELPETLRSVFGLSLPAEHEEALITRVREIAAR